MSKPKEIILLQTGFVSARDLGDTSPGISRAVATKYLQFRSLDDLKAHLQPPVVEIKQERPPEKLAASSIFTANEFPKANPNAGELVADEKELSEWITPDFLHFTSAQILDSYFGPDDLVSATFPAQGPKVARYKEIRDRLQNFTAIDPNPLGLGEPPKRKILVTRLSPGINFAAQGRRVSYLRRFGELTLLAMDVRCGILEAWWNTAGLTPAKVQKFFARAVGRKCGPTVWNKRLES